MRRPRHLSPEERALWDQVARQAEPLEKPQAEKPRKPVAPVPAPKKRGRQPQPTQTGRFGIGDKVDHHADHDLLPSLVEQMGRAPVMMDRKTHQKMRRGKLSPDRRIDLHGMTLAQAHPALTGFILQSQAMGHRLVLVITGKGKDRDDGGPIPTRLGVLRHQVPHWLSTPPLVQAVLQVTPASQRHGGAGAYYVYLKRLR